MSDHYDDCPEHPRNFNSADPKPGGCACARIEADLADHAQQLHVDARLDDLRLGNE